MISATGSGPRSAARSLKSVPRWLRLEEGRHSDGARRSARPPRGLGQAGVAIGGVVVVGSDHDARERQPAADDLRDGREVAASNAITTGRPVASRIEAAVAKPSAITIWSPGSPSRWNRPLLRPPLRNSLVPSGAIVS